MLKTNYIEIMVLIFINLKLKKLKWNIMIIKKYIELRVQNYEFRIKFYKIYILTVIMLIFFKKYINVT